MPQIFITKLGPQVTEEDLEREFSKFGDIKKVNLKRGYAFVEYYHKADAKYAIRELDNQRLFGQNQRIVVEEAIGSKREREHERQRERERRRDRDRDHDRRDKDRYRDKYKNDRDRYSNKQKQRKRGPKENDECFNCGKLGHWANECPDKKGKQVFLKLNIYQFFIIFLIFYIF